MLRMWSACVRVCMCVNTCVYKHVRVWGLVCHWRATSTVRDHRLFIQTLLLFFAFLWVASNMCDWSRLILRPLSSNNGEDVWGKESGNATDCQRQCLFFFSRFVSPPHTHLILLSPWPEEERSRNPSLPLGLENIQKKSKDTDILVLMHTCTKAKTNTHWP